MYFFFPVSFLLGSADRRRWREPERLQKGRWLFLLPFGPASGFLRPLGTMVITLSAGERPLCIHIPKLKCWAQLNRGPPPRCRGISTRGHHLCPSYRIGRITGLLLELLWCVSSLVPFLRSLKLQAPPSAPEKIEQYRQHPLLNSNSVRPLPQTLHFPGCP